MYIYHKLFNNKVILNYFNISKYKKILIKEHNLIVIIFIYINYNKIEKYKNKKDLEIKLFKIKLLHIKKIFQSTKSFKNQF